IVEGNKLFIKGDYYYALEFFEKAYELDSNSVELLWQMAETYRAYKDYRKAEEFYDKTFKREEGLLYETSILQLALMQKMNGKYDLALETFKSAKKKYARSKKDYPYLKSKKEIESCLFAMNLDSTKGVSIRHLPENINSKNSEFGHTFTPDNYLIFSSLKGDSINEKEEVYGKDYRTKLYKANFNDSTQSAELITDLVFREMNTGNGSFSASGKRFYFSLCTENQENYRCKIMVSTYNEGQWSEVDSLGEIINHPGSNASMPMIQTINGEEFLFFSSDKEGGEGGMDIYYCTVKNGNQFSTPKNIKSINSIENELNPHFDLNEKRLYFSSNWHDGLGGYDVFYSTFEENQFSSPTNAGKPINSSANDLYYFKNKNKAYVTSNRVGVNYSKNPTCCSDIFELTQIEPPTIIDTTIVVLETLEELNKRLPVTLYFHNDEPNPRSFDTTTRINYLNSYNDYRAMLGKYQDEYSKDLKRQDAADAREDIESFFIEFVDQGVKDLSLFRDLLLEELKKGRKIKVTIKGFASPLAKSDYNINLTKRRISSLQNYLLSYQDSVFAPYFFGNSLEGGQLMFEEVPFGEDKSDQLVSDNLNDKKNSVYSRAAALERKIEIQSVSFFKTEMNKTTYLPTFDTTIVDLGRISNTQKVVAKYSLTNISDTVLEIENIRVPCNCSEGKITNSIVQPGEKTQIEFIFDPKEYEGPVVKSIYVKIKNIDEEIRLILLTQVIPE
ncbi:MAG: DUF1573 domain-containing protein, partial [Bacteroidetes bacterium]|nr:DUF1573 domain-containing protein [Bacteroidota bacterium]